MSVRDRSASACDGRLSRPAVGQHGVVSARQLRARASARRRHRRVADGRLGRTARLRARSPRRALAAALALGRRCPASRRRAYTSFARATEWRSTSPCHAARGRAGITVHETGGLDPGDRRSTAIPASRVDLDPAHAARPRRDPAAQPSSGAPTSRRSDCGCSTCARSSELLGPLERAPRSRRPARPGFAYDPAPAAEARSELELRFLDLVREAGLPPPQVNVLVEGFVVDAYWPSARLVVELQGYAYHSDRDAFERDHARLARLKLAGYEVLALTWRQVAARAGVGGGGAFGALKPGSAGLGPGCRRCQGSRQPSRLSADVRVESRPLGPARARAREPRASGCRRTSGCRTTPPATSFAPPCATAPSWAARRRSTWIGATWSPTR